ncbi:hypothetical protein ACE414_10375 [Alteromonas macleodii]|jgi:hypothetical protein|uniref:Uncharacterized protein n=1 Tax=Alteromonas portus TaxID=2565549 RepID=A0A4U0ZIK4_9ALTE|nr:MULTISPECIES: hypothetical protein [Alteromonas]MEA3482783.1 hypothetical protein [Pseudomonadota bacterium]TKB03913.1 hypothetical protein E5672_07440 [Alteromonas portus]GFD81011.1 hypothetical protein KUL118_38730 [Tenacibaculum sp. KUL118]|tara:strand:+ start:598 stop:879 length:282 start_codon:yes stop_codon:yes gene_type:complete
MSFQDDLAADMESVFFADFKHVAVISGVEVNGYLYTRAHEFGELDTNQVQFDTPKTSLPAIKRREPITVNGVKYLFVTKQESGEVTSLILERV